MEKMFQNVFIALLVICLPAVVPSFGQSGGDYDLSWITIDGGGGVSSGGQYIVRGTIGQPDAGVMSGGDYKLAGGFWFSVPVCAVDFYQYARFAKYWLETGSNLPADLYQDEYDSVDYLDLAAFVDGWLHNCPYGWPLR